MKTEKDGEVACYARNGVFIVEGKKVSRGVTSYYAASALSQAKTMSAWLECIKKAVSADNRRLNLQVVGNKAMVLPGSVVTSRGVTRGGAKVSRPSSNAWEKR